jgi:hypothetical protein
MLPKGAAPTTFLFQQLSNNLDLTISMYITLKIPNYFQVVVPLERISEELILPLGVSR